jgi:hypothetical protein
MSHIRARLLRVALQPVFVIDDGENLREVPGNTVQVPGADWRAFVENAFGDDDLDQVRVEYAAANGTAATALAEETEGASTEEGGG